jgi:hypothetical protein
MTLVHMVTRTAEGHAVKEHAVVTYLGRLSNDDTDSVIYEEASPYLRPRVYLDTRQKSVARRYEAWQHRDPESHVKAVRDPVDQDRVQSGIAQPNLDDASGGGVVLPYSCDVVEEERSHIHYLKRSVLM